MTGDGDAVVSDFIGEGDGDIMDEFSSSMGTGCNALLTTSVVTVTVLAFLGFGFLLALLISDILRAWGTYLLSNSDLSFCQLSEL